MNSFDQLVGDNFKDDAETFSRIFQLYDRNSDNFIDESEFGELLTDLLHSSDSSDKTNVALTQSHISALFSTLDLDKDGHISLEEFKCAWRYWLRQILKPVKALVIVDVQNDFISGSLSLSNCPAGQDGSAVVPIINKLLDQNLFDLVVYTYDWHPNDHISFADNVQCRLLHSASQVGADKAKEMDTVIFDIDGTPREQILWPRHCTQGSWGAELHPNLKVVDNAFHVKKGMNSDVDSYSAFWDNDKLSRTELSTILSDNKVTDVYVCGVAYDVCVGFTAHHAVDHGFRTVFIEDASRGVSLDGIGKMRSELMAKGVHMANSSEVPQLTQCENRPLSLAVQAALNYKLAWKIVKEKLKTNS